MKNSWDHFKGSCFYSGALNFMIDYSRIEDARSIFKELSGEISSAFEAMIKLEAGAIANPDEKRMVGHYWLRNPERSPTAEIKKQITDALSSVKSFVASLHNGSITGSTGKKFSSALIVGIGGSALGPQFVYQALRTPKDPLKMYFFDNTDPDGMQRVLDEIEDLSKTLVVVISKSGGTKETRNGQLIAKQAFQSQGLSLSKHFVAVTGEGSELDKTAVLEGWLGRFPMWDWVGGRTSELSAVGLLPAALHGADIDSMLQGAREMDELTREAVAERNPAMILALMWHKVGKGRGAKDMVLLPYKDRFELFSRYLQQLVMESLGKEFDLSGKTVNQGIAVYGNKGSTDQHAYVQQLRDGINNFFAVFLNVLMDSPTKSMASALEVEPGITSGNYLLGFHLGTKSALFEKGRESISITVEKADAKCIGMLIALFERAVGFYASLVNINAYHQPGVEAGKKAAARVLDIQKLILELLSSSKNDLSIDSIISSLIQKGSLKEEESETVFHILRHLSANGRIAEIKGASSKESPFSNSYRSI